LKLGENNEQIKNYRTVQQFAQKRARDQQATLSALYRGCCQ